MKMNTKRSGVSATIAALLVVVESATLNNVVIKQCNEMDTFLKFFGGSLRDCMEECDRRSRCRSIMYTQRMNHCSLKDNVVGDIIDGMGVNEAQCMFLNTTDWISSENSPCNGHKCNVTETCVSPKHGLQVFSCLISECPPLPAITNSFLLSYTRTIGSVNRYHCENGFRSFGTPLITCNSSAEWERSDLFWCERRCSKPMTSHSNALLSQIDFVGAFMYQREVLRFTCRNEYKALGPNVSSTCHQNGYWDYHRVKCCPNGTYQIAWNNRCLFYTGQLTSYDQFEQMCTSRGYKKTGYDKRLTEYMLRENLAENLLMPDTKSDIETKYNDSLIECFRNENITLTNITYDEKIQFERESNVTMTHGACELVTWWAPSEPNGGMVENCTMVKTNETGYILYDIPCDNLTNLNLGAFCHWNLPSV